MSASDDAARREEHQVEVDERVGPQELDQPVRRALVVIEIAARGAGRAEQPRAPARKATLVQQAQQLASAQPGSADIENILENRQ